MPLSGIKDADIGEPVGREHAGGEFRAAPDRFRVKPRETDAGDPDQFLQIVEIGRSRFAEVRQGCGKVVAIHARLLREK
jgi:hypothetical protein